jgi:hypothetical protein
METFGFPVGIIELLKKNSIYKMQLIILIAFIMIAFQNGIKNIIYQNVIC